MAYFTEIPRSPEDYHDSRTACCAWAVAMPYPGTKINLIGIFELNGNIVKPNFAQWIGDCVSSVTASQTANSTIVMEGSWPAQKDGRMNAGKPSRVPAMIARCS